MLDREGVAGALTMIQPQLFAYGFGQPPRPVLLDVQVTCFPHQVGLERRSMKSGLHDILLIMNFIYDEFHSGAYKTVLVIYDVQSVRPDEVLLLDAFFMVVVHCGSTVAQWRKAGYHRQEEHQAFR